jgi:geranylgeranyl transferase type-2 subunit beta
LYYTGFALRGLAVLGALQGETARVAADYLRSRLVGRETIVDFLSLVYGAMLVESAAGIDVFSDAPPTWRDAVSTTLELLRRADGGYAKGPAGAISSTYHSFLVLLCRELIGRPVEGPERLVEFIRSQRADGGGFREIRASKRAGTNPTAAAIGTLRILNALDETTRESTVEFLAEMQTDEGGLRANTRIPIADLLSTFTGCLTLQDLDAWDVVDAHAVSRFAQSMENASGGFRGGELDPGDDVEYTFYGLGCLALLERT